MSTPVKDPQINSRRNENTNPNLTISTPKQKLGNSNSPLKKSVKKSEKKKSLLQFDSPQNKIQNRKFIVAKKKKPKSAEAVVSNAACKCENKMEGIKKCPCIAYQNLRASQEDFFKKPQVCDRAEVEEEEKKEDNADDDIAEGFSPNSKLEATDEVEVEGSPKAGSTSSTVKRRRAKVLEDARKSIPELGNGQVMHLVEAFEKLSTIPLKPKELKEGDDEGGDEKRKGMKWGFPLPGLQPPRVHQDTESPLSSFAPSDFFFTSDSLGMDSRVTSSLDSSRGSISSRTSGGSRRSRRNSCDSTSTFGGSKWKKKQLRITRQKPFKLITEQRGRSKEEEFMKKVQEMCMEEEKLRIPIAQGLPWTTDEPECLVKPPVKENTRPIDLKLYTDMRAVERAEFDHYVTEKFSLIEQYKMERERQQKLAEEEEIKRLRRELVPKAQPMPYFDRPFVPQRSSKNPTVPKEPRFHNPQHKKIKCMSWNDIDIYTHQH
ncbi:hypothetical protein ACHQM5_006531 [Ranunculus cassubicifolius]